MSQPFTNHVDIAQVVLYAFWIFFAGLIFYLHRENKREGYPLEPEVPRDDRVVIGGFPEPPSTKVFRSHDGAVFSNPSHAQDRADAPVVPTARWPGAPFKPSGDPMSDGVGPASFADRADVPERGMSGQPILMPLRKALMHSVAPDGPNPIGMTVVDRRGSKVGPVVDIWIDEAESIIRYLEVDVGAGTRLLPITMARVRGSRREIEVASILADQFAAIPAIKAVDEVTKREEDRIVAFFAGGPFYAGRRDSKRA